MNKIWDNPRYFAYFRLREPRLETQLATNRVPFVTERLLSMATAAREWHSAKGGCEALPPTKLARIFLPPGGPVVRDLLITKVSLLLKVVATLPKVGNSAAL